MGVPEYEAGFWSRVHEYRRGLPQNRAADWWGRAWLLAREEDHLAALAEDERRRTSSPEDRRAHQLAEVIATETKALEELAAWSRILNDAVALRRKLEGWPAGDVKFRGHDFEAGYSGMVCGAMVLRPDGSGDECGEPVFSPIHDPQKYLKYTQELHDALAEWRLSSS